MDRVDIKEVTGWFTYYSTRSFSTPVDDAEKAFLAADYHGVTSIKNLRR